MGNYGCGIVYNSLLAIHEYVYAAAQKISDIVVTNALLSLRFSMCTPRLFMR